LAVITCCLWLTAHFSAQQPSWKPSITLGLPDDAWGYYFPKNNPMTPAKKELGRKLFFDARPSAEGRVSRSSWHDPKLALTDGRAVSERDLKQETPTTKTSTKL
jgi:cytochrome c peroxidase